MATIRIPTPLRKLTQGKEEVTATGGTIGALIASLETQYPGIKERICDDSGQVRRFVNIFANDEDIRFLKNLETPVKDTRRDLDRAGHRGRRASQPASTVTWTSPPSRATRDRSRCPRSVPRGRTAHLGRARAGGGRAARRAGDGGRLPERGGRRRGDRRARPRPRTAAPGWRRWPASISSSASASTTTRCWARPSGSACRWSSRASRRTQVDLHLLPAPRAGARRLARRPGAAGRARGPRRGRRRRRHAGRRRGAGPDRARRWRHRRASATCGCRSTAARPLAQEIGVA